MCISLEPLSSFDFEQSDRLDEPTINASMVPYAVIELSPTPHPPHRKYGCDWPDRGQVCGHSVGTGGGPDTYA